MAKDITANSTSKGGVLSLHNSTTGKKLTMEVDSLLDIDVRVLIPKPKTEEPVRLVTEEHLGELVRESNDRYVKTEILPQVNVEINRKYEQEITPNIRNMLANNERQVDNKLKEVTALTKQTRDLIDVKNVQAKEEILVSVNSRLTQYSTEVNNTIRDFKNTAEETNTELRSNFDIMSKELEANTNKQLEAISNFRSEVEDKLGIMRDDLTPEEVIAFVKSVSSLPNSDDWRRRGSNVVYSKVENRDVSDEANVLLNILQKDYNDLRDTEGRKYNIEEKIQILANDLKATAAAAVRGVPTGTIIFVYGKRYKGDNQVFYDDEIKQNYLPCNGATINVDVYPELAEALGYKGIIKKTLTYSNYYILQETKFINSLIHGFGRANETKANDENIFSSFQRLGLDNYSTWYTANEAMIKSRNEYRSPSNYTEIEDEFKKVEYDHIRREYQEGGKLSKLQYQQSANKTIYIDTTRPDNDNIVVNTTGIVDRSIQLPNLSKKYIKVTTVPNEIGTIGEAGIPRMGGEVRGFAHNPGGTNTMYDGEFRLTRSSSNYSVVNRSSGSGLDNAQINFKPWETSPAYMRLMKDTSRETIDVDHVVLMAFIKI